MITNLKPYSTYEDSGVPWLGEVPKHWATAAVKRHYNIQLGKMLQGQPVGLDDMEVPYLKAQHVQWFSVRMSPAPKMYASTRDLEHFGIANGDLLVCEGGEGGRSGLVKENAEGYIIQNALHRVRAINTCRNDFLQYVMKVIAATGWFDAINSKATIAHFTREKFGALCVPIPQASEQTAIVRFLDHADRKIRRYISAKQKLIKLLSEQKQVIIHRAVTCGLDPNVRLKPSGIEWLGDIPEHWEVRKLGSIGRVFNGTTPSRNQSSYWNGGTIPWLSSGKVNDGIVESPSELITEVAFRETSVAIVPRGSVILGLVGQGKTRGMCALLNIDTCINQNLAAIVPRKPVEGRYLYYMLTAFYKTIRESGRGGNQEALNCEIVSLLRLPLPPLDEQRMIVGYLDRELPAANDAQVKSRREIDLLHEYRTRLIADVVTGKLDVREAAATLPNEAEEPELPEEVEEVTEGEEIVEVADLETEDAIV